MTASSDRKSVSVPHVLLCGSVHEEGMALLEGNAEVTHAVIEDDPVALAEHLAGADALVIRIAKLAPEVVEGAPRLKVVSRHGVGCDNLPVDLLTARGIPIMITGTANSAAVAEHAIYMMFAVARRALLSDRMVRTGGWEGRKLLTTMELAGRRLLLLGFGRIGRQVAVKAQALGMVVSVHDPYVDAATCAAVGVTHVADMLAALPSADVLSLHLPSSGEAVIGKRELDLLPDQALLVNVARGDLVDEEALAATLRAGRLLGAGLDVFGVEPPASDNPLLGCDNVIMSPHSASHTGASMCRMGITSVQNSLDALAGKLAPSMVFNPGWDTANP